MNKTLWRCATKGLSFGSIIDPEYIKSATALEAVQLYKEHYGRAFEEFYVCEVGWLKRRYEVHIIPSDDGMKYVKVKTSFRIWSF